MNKNAWTISAGNGNEKSVEKLREKVREMITLAIANPTRCVLGFGQTGINEHSDMTEDMLAYCHAQDALLEDGW